MISSSRKLISFDVLEKGSHAMESDDGNVLYRQLFRKKQREYLRTVICDEIIEEHRKSPLGRHSEPLERLLLYFRYAPQRGKYVVKRNEKSRKFQIAQLSGERDAPLREVSDAEYGTAEEVYHEIFLRRVHELLESDT
jgi:branched-chain amino acid transport system permease protein